MLERIAVHQTRLRVPGLGLDARGVALGSRGLVLLPSLDRLVAFLAVYTEQQSLGGLSDSLRIEIVRSKLGTREVVLTFDAGSSDRLDRVSEVARLTGGFTFTGTSRHFVQFRDASAPFGFDSSEVLQTSSTFALYHQTFSQTYDSERVIELRSLLLRLAPHADPSAKLGGGPLWVLADAGLGPSLLSYFARSGVAASVGVAEWPPETSFDEEPVRRFLFQVQDMPARLRPLLANTPGLAAYLQVTSGAAVEHGYHHPIALEACPVFEPQGLVLFRGRGEPPLELEQVPAMAELSTLKRADLDLERNVLRGDPGQHPDLVRVPVRLLADPAAPAGVAAAHVPIEELELLRRLAYALPPETIRRTKVILTDLGVFLLGDGASDGIPLGHLYWRYHAQVFVPLGSRLVPAVEPEVLFRSLGSPAGELLFFRPDGSALSIPGRAAVPLDTALLAGPRWAPVTVTELDEVFAEELPTVWLEELGRSAMRGVEV
ncbi:MAG: hypothetical protein KF718_25980 [Polyangiaceae bacterium]|nr:hypothetical protein [Polyangiaceae bacterium]